MANANITLITLANTIDHWRIVTNQIANSVNELRNGNYYKDGGNLTLANGSINLINGSGTLLSVSGNVTISQRLTSNTIINSGDVTVQGNNALFTSNTVLVQVANTIITKNLISNVSITAQNINAAGYFALTGNNLASALSPTISAFNELALLNLNTHFMVSNTGNTISNGSIRLLNAARSLNVSGNGNVGVDFAIGGNLSVLGNATISGSVTANSLNVNNITALSGRINTLTSYVITLDPAATFGINNGNAVLNNLTVQGNQTILGATINESDEIVIRANIATDGIGKLSVARGTGNNNATVRFLHTSNVWQLSSNNQQTFSTIISTANLVDTFTNTSNIHVATANAVNAAYASAIVNATAVVANGGVFVAQRKGINIIAGNNISLNISANGANTQLTDVRLTSTVSVVDSITSTDNTSAASANSVNWLRLQSLQKSGDSMTGNLIMANNHIQNPTLKGYREAVNNIVATSANVVIDMGLFNHYIITLAGNPNFQFTNCGPTGNVSTITLYVRQSANGGNTFYANQNTIRWNDNTTPVLTSSANTMDALYITTFSEGSIFYGSQVMANIPLS